MCPKNWPTPIRRRDLHRRGTPVVLLHIVLPVHIALLLVDRLDRR
jgi:hypothetical protein